MDYSVRVKPGHPTGVRHRGGKKFTAEPTRISEKELTKDIKADPWLIVEEAKAAVDTMLGGAGNDTIQDGDGADEKKEKKGWAFGKKKG